MPPNNHEENDKKRINDLITISKTIEQYYAIKGSYPLVENNNQAVNVPIDTFNVKWDIPTKTANTLNQELSAVIGKTIVLPTDPVGYKASEGRRIYQYYSNGKMYAVSAHLYFPTEFTRKLGINGHKFQIASFHEPDSALIDIETAKKTHGGRKIYPDVQKSFFEAMSQNSIAGMQKAIAEGAILDFPCNKNEICKPLARSITQDLESKTVEFLLENSANPNGRNAYGDTPLIFALMDEKDAIVNLLLKAGANVNQANYFGATPFFGVCAGGDITQVKKFYKFGGEVNPTNNENNGAKCNNIPLISAVEEGHYEVAKYLIEKGANPFQTNSQGISAADLIKEKKKKKFELLIKSTDIKK